MRIGFAVPLLVALVLPSGAPAQAASDDEVRLLESASRAEVAGDLAGAEGQLRRVLEDRPSSTPALLALERVLRTQARLEELVPLTDRALEEEPRSALLNQLRVRTVAEVGGREALARAAQAWIRASPEIEIPYREVASVWVAQGEPGRARSVLEEGRRRLGPTALALELGDLYASMGEPTLAVREWRRAIDGDGGGVIQVRRRLRSLPDGGASVVAELVDGLVSDGAGGRLDAALELAVEGGLEDRARSIGAARLPQLPPLERRGRLERLARAADSEGLRSLAHWAYSELLELEWADASRGRLAALHARVAELALELGDTAAASDGYRAVEERFPAGSPQRREAAAARVELLAGQDADAALEALEAFEAEYPGSQETDRLTAAVAERLLLDRRRERAARLVADAPGPRATLVRARLLLSAGDVAAARMALMAAAPGLRGGEATEVLSLVTLLGRVSVEAGIVVGQALEAVGAGEPGEAVDRVVASLEGLPAPDRPALLELAAALAEDHQLDAEARSLRRQLVSHHPRSAEAPAALLALARGLSAEAGGRGEARELLERLIIEHPRSALVPQARQALAGLGREDAE